ncbi:MAG: flavin reductase [Marmoricola sp.]|nr:flavin reductase [Marmoricola sp.]
MIIDPHTLDAEAAYRLLTGIVVPRPIAWVTTRSADGIVNLAPFSAFTMVSNSPPIVGINIGARAGSRKDTARNIHETSQFVINIPTWDMRSTVHDSSREFAPHINEADELGLELIDSDLISPPRLAATPISLECELDRIVEFGDSGSEFITGRIVRFHIRDNLYENGKIDTGLLDPAARIAGPSYSRIKVVDTLAPIALSPKITKSKNGGVSI